MTGFVGAETRGHGEAVGDVDPRDVGCALERNVVLSAGAGTGKTHRLVTLCLHLLGGARSGGAVRPGELAVLTFTEKAGDELRERIRRRLTPLAEGSPGALELEPELSRAFSRLGVSPPPPAHWRACLDGLGGAAVGTFHSFSATLLRRMPGAAPVGFTLMDEDASARQLREVVERVVLDALEGGDEEAIELCSGMGYGGRSGVGMGLLDELERTFQTVRESGESPEGLRARSEDEALAELQELMAEARRLAAEGLAEDLAREPTKQDPSVARACSLLDTKDPEQLEARFGELRELLAVARWGTKGKPESLKALNTLLRGALPGALFGRHSLPYERAFLALVAETSRRYAVALERRRVLDFTELQLRARDVLARQPDQRARVQQGLRALLVDELQDTNRVQLELVHLLAERREGGPRQLGGDMASPLDLPLEPAFLAAVGDAKQSIYEFRGADVSVFGELAEAVERQGGEVVPLKTNRRSSAALIGALNPLFTEVLAASSDRRPYEVGYLPERDDLLPFREGGAPIGPVLTRGTAGPEAAAARRAEEADALAQWLAAALGACRSNHSASRDGRSAAPEGVGPLERAEGPALRRPSSAACISPASLGPGHPDTLLNEAPSAPRIVEGDGERPIRGEDVALLFGAFTGVETYKQALIRHGVPHRVLRGRGFFDAQEVRDLAALLALAADPSDAVAFATVLRSPLVGLTDEGLVRVSLACGGAPRLDSLERALAQGEGPSLSPGEDARLERFVTTCRRALYEARWTGCAGLLEALIDATDYATALAGAPHGEQALANVEKLVARARRFDELGEGNVAQLAEELRQAAESNPREAEAELLEDGAPGVVTLLTVHQSKGLEWPVVAVVDMARPCPTAKGRAHWDRTLGFGLAPLRPEWAMAREAPHLTRLKEERKRRGAAEHARLFYVAATRARDLLIFTGGSGKAQKGSWWKQLEAAAAARPELAAAMAELEPPEPPKTLLNRGSSEELDRRHLEEARRRLERVRAPVPRAPSRATLTVTALTHFADCPRRHHLLDVLQLEEPRRGAPRRSPTASSKREGLPGGVPMTSATPSPAPAPAPAPALLASPAALGTAVHRLLELAPLSAFGDPEPQRALSALAPGPEALETLGGLVPLREEAQSLAARFLRSPFARRLAALGEARVHRELPFLLRLEGETASGPPLFLKGTMDLVVEDEEGGLLVLDYKTTRRPRDGLARHRLQLTCYAAAARALIGQGPRIRTGIVFLREDDPAPELDPGPASGSEGLFGSDDEPGRVARELVGVSSGKMPLRGQPASRCRALGCGFVALCHPRS